MFHFVSFIFCSEQGLHNTQLNKAVETGQQGLGMHLQLPIFTMNKYENM